MGGKGGLRDHMRTVCVCETTGASDVHTLTVMLYRRTGTTCLENMLRRRTARPNISCYLACHAPLDEHGGLLLRVPCSACVHPAPEDHEGLLGTMRVITPRRRGGNRLTNTPLSEPHMLNSILGYINIYIYIYIYICREIYVYIIHIYICIYERRPAPG